MLCVMKHFDILSHFCTTPVCWYICLIHQYCDDERGEKKEKIQQSALDDLMRPQTDSSGIIIVFFLTAKKSKNKIFVRKVISTCSCLF